MASATTLSEYVLAVAALVSAATPIVMARRKAGHVQDATVLKSFTALNDALGKEVERLQGDMIKLRDDYEKRLASAQDRITDLEREIQTLQRLLGKREPA